MWEIYAYQNAASLNGVFNAAAAIHGSGDYLSAVALAAFCGFVAALIAYTFAPEKLQGWKWLASVTLIFAVLIVPKVTVGVVDKTGGSAVQVIDNVPFGAAVLGSLTSTVGHTLTTLFETAFQVLPGKAQLPAELSYSQNGLMFGSRLIRESANVVFPDPNFRTDLINFIHNCTTYDLLDGTLDPAAFSQSDDIWALMSTPNPARFTSISQTIGISRIDTCPNAYTNLSTRLPTQIAKIEGQLAFQLNPTLPKSAAAAVIAGQIQQAYLKNEIASASATAADLIRQNAMINAVADTSKLAGQKANDPAAMVLAIGRAQGVAQQNAAWINTGKVAEQALPVFRNVIEALTYALFPLLVLLLMLTSGRDTQTAIKGYVTILIWIQLWPPLYAVLNYMATVYASYDLAAAASIDSSDHALALQTASAIYSRTISGEAVVGYLSFSVPFIAWAALKRMENFGSVLVGGLSGLNAMLGASTSAAAVGNAAMGNVVMDQMRLAPNRTSAFMRNWQHDLSGDTFSSNALTGTTAMSLLRNQGFASRVVSLKVSEQDTQEASRQASAARSQSLQVSRQRGAALSEVFDRSVGRLNATRDSSATVSSEFEQLGKGINELQQITESVANNTGLSQTQVANIAFGVGAHTAVKTPRFVPVDAGARMEAKAQKSYLSGLTQQEQKVLGSMSTEQLAAFQQFGDRVSNDRSILNEISEDGREASGLSARLTSLTSQANQSQAAYAEQMAYAERLSTAYERGESISIDLAQDPHNVEMFSRYARQYGGNSASAQAMMEAELGRRALSPNRVFTDGSAVPASFMDVSAQHGLNQRNVGSTSVDGLHQRNMEQVRTFDHQVSGMSAPAGAHGVRHKVQSQEAAMKARTSADARQFDEKANLVETESGSLTSDNSLLMQAADQVANDASGTVESAKDLLKLRSRK